MRQIGLPMERLTSPDELCVVLSGFLTPRPRRFGPAIVDVSASDHLIADGLFRAAFDLGKLPPTIVTDWIAPLLDGDLPLDVAIDVEPLDLAWAKLQLDARRNALESSAPTPGRQVALEQIAGLRMAYERRQTLPMRMAITVVVRAWDRHTLERRTKRLRQRVKDPWVHQVPMSRPPAFSTAARFWSPRVTVSLRLRTPWSVHFNNPMYVGMGCSSLPASLAPSGKAGRT